MTVKKWFLEKNYQRDEMYLMSTVEPTVERETEKACLLNWNTDCGTIKGWFPKSVVVTDEIPDDWKTVVFEVNDKVNHKTFGEGIIEEVKTVENTVMYIVKFGKTTKSIMGNSHLTKIN